VPIQIDGEAAIDELQTKISEHVLAAMPADPSGELAGLDFHGLLVAYGNWRTRFIKAKPRTAHLSTELRASPELATHRPAVDAIVATIRAGGDLTPHLSRRIKTAYVPAAQRRGHLGRRGDLDLLISDWGLHHLHLTTQMEADGFYKRTDDLLFAKFTDSDAYLLAIYDHGGNWADQDLIRIIVDNWHGAGLTPGLTGFALTAQPTNSDILAARGAGVQQFVQVGNTVYMPAGMTTAGTPIAVTMAANQLLHTFRELRGTLPDVLAQIEAQFDEKAAELSKESVWEAAIYAEQWGFRKGDVFIPGGDLW
jgi:hypothetical protein